MRENNDMEILMRLKMEEFLVEPAPADWQAIYEQLHPKKRRRFFWWWLPLATGLSLFGAYWLISDGQKNETAQEQAEQIKTMTPSAPEKDRYEPSAPIPNNIQLSQAAPTDPISAVTAERSAAEPIVSNFTKTSERIPKSSKMKIGPKEIQDAQPTEDASTQFSANLKKTRNTDPSKPGELKNVTPAVDEATAALEASKSSPGRPVSKDPTPEVSETVQTAVDPPATPADPALDPKTIKAIPGDPAVDLKTPKTIPRHSNHAEKGWYLGLYTGFGINNPVEPISMVKFTADYNSFPSQGSSYTTVNIDDKNGPHFALGLAIERKLKKISLSTGLGLQFNSWSSNQVIYKDSIVSGSFFSRTSVAKNTVDYKYLALEIPLILNFKLAGKKQNSYWINAGLNNAITLMLDKRSNQIPLQGNASISQDNSSGNASIFQPQLRLGLMYENAQKNFHWQLSPFVQYGLTNMSAAGNPDVHLLQFGLQGRYYFKKIR